MRHAEMPLNERIEAALERIKTGQAAMRVPVEATDPDIVLADCATTIAALRTLATTLGGAAAALLKDEGAEEFCGDPNCDICIDYRDLRSALAAYEAAKKEGGPLC